MAKARPSLPTRGPVLGLFLRMAAYCPRGPPRLRFDTIKTGEGAGGGGVVHGAATWNNDRIKRLVPGTEGESGCCKMKDPGQAQSRKLPKEVFVAETPVEFRSQANFRRRAATGQRRARGAVDGPWGKMAARVAASPSTSDQACIRTYVKLNRKKRKCKTIYGGKRCQGCVTSNELFDSYLFSCFH
jgi:hypothetical protein